LAGEAPIVLFGESVVDDSGARFAGIGFFEALSDTAPIRIGFGGCAAGSGEAGVASGFERGDVGSAEIVE
jgi:hypothetical protein